MPETPGQGVRGETENQGEYTRDGNVYTVFVKQKKRDRHAFLLTTWGEVVGVFASFPPFLPPARPSHLLPLPTFLTPLEESGVWAGTGQRTARSSSCPRARSVVGRHLWAYRALSPRHHPFAPVNPFLSVADQASGGSFCPGPGPLDLTPTLNPSLPPSFAPCLLPPFLPLPPTPASAPPPSPAQPGPRQSWRPP